MPETKYIRIILLGLLGFVFSTTRLNSQTTFTTEQIMSAPRYVKSQGDFFYGVNDTNIYFSKGNDTHWNIVASVDFRIIDFNFMNDSTLILWDGFKNNYTFSFHDQSPVLYSVSNPIKEFISQPIKTFTIRSSQSGCFHRKVNEIIYTNDNKSNLITLNYNVDGRTEKTVPFRNKIILSNIETILSKINNDPSFVPSIADFKLTDQDKQDYVRYVQNINNKDVLSWKNTPEIKDQKLLDSIYRSIDTLSSYTLEKIMDQRYMFVSTNSYWTVVYLVNESNDTLTFMKHSYSGSNHNLPWMVEYRGFYFNCYRLELSNFINSCLPKGFLNKNFYTNRNLLIEVANYLFRNEDKY